jgi:hypothetical protein
LTELDGKVDVRDKSCGRRGLSSKKEGAALRRRQQKGKLHRNQRERN